jgi:Zn-dependent protease
MNPQLLIQALGWYIAFLVSTTLHEASHAFVALKLGDPTAYQGGQVTLDPIPHIRREPFGMFLVPLLSFVLGGWMFGWGSAPYDPQWALNNPKKSGWMALAGPAANLFLVILTGILIRVGLAAGFFAAPQSILFTEVVLPLDNNSLTGVAAFISIMFSLNLILLCFNLLPVPPLDGSALPLMFLEPDRARRYMDILHNPQFSLIGIIIAWNVFDHIFAPIHLFGVNLLYHGIAHYG